MQDRAQRETAPLQKAHLVRALAFIRRRRGEAARPDARDVGPRFLAGGAERRVDLILGDALGAQALRELHRTEAPRLRADRLLGEARVRQPPAARELVEHRADVVGLGREGIQLARELDARMLTPREKTQRPGAKRWFGLATHGRQSVA